MTASPTKQAVAPGEASRVEAAGENLTRSLRALGHPLTLICVAILLVNDHILKRLYPSDLTGKLSDFAGLFFFPFLLTATVALLASAFSLLGSTVRIRRPRFESRLPFTVLSTYFVTGLLFSITKVSPSFNAAINHLLNRLSGLPVRITLDATDLVALVALAPSLGLLLKVESRGHTPPAHRSLVVVGLACLAVLATSPCPPPQPVTRLVQTEAGVYALAVAWEPISNAFISADGGLSWDYREPESLPADVLAVAAQPPALPQTVCVPKQEQVCYRIRGEEMLEASADGGKTWEIAWSISASRRTYMARVASGHGQLLACGKDLDLRANDLVVAGSGKEHTAIVALGNEGVLRGSYDAADWTRVGVGWAEPTPIRGELGDLLPPMIIGGETLLALGAAGAAFCLLSVVAWSRLGSHDAERADERKRLPPWAIGIVVDVCLLLLMALVNLEELMTWVAPPLIILTMIVASMVAGWSKAYRRVNGADEARRALKVVSYVAVMVGVLGWVPFGLWVVGTIPGYSAALIIAVIGVVLVTTYALGRLPRPSRPDPQTSKASAIES